MYFSSYWIPVSGNWPIFSDVLCATRDWGTEHTGAGLKLFCLKCHSCPWGRRVSIWHGGKLELLDEPKWWAQYHGSCKWALWEVQSRTKCKSATVGADLPTFFPSILSYLHLSLPSSLYAHNVHEQLVHVYTSVSLFMYKKDMCSLRAASSALIHWDSRTCVYLARLMPTS